MILTVIDNSHLKIKLKNMRLNLSNWTGGVDAPPIYRSRKTSLKKTLIYRLVVDPVALLITYIMTGELSGSILAVILIEVFSTIFYYVLDRLV